ncbi:MAG TPA: TraM recognition domain-containing protein [Ktedonobacteraceae bacterium]|nr:TraM recognition domain-containing protein [Ktedonobacteraceae bacterium]
MTFTLLGMDTQTGQRVEAPKLSRLLGFYIIGLQGMGKSGLFEEMIVQDIKQGIGVCVLDPHGELVDNIIARLPDGKEEKVIYLDLAETNYFFGLNLFACPDPVSDDEITKTVSQVAHVFEKAFGVSMSDTPRIYDYLFNSAYTLIANPGYTLIDIPLVFTAAVLKRFLANVPSAEVLRFWDDVNQLPKPDQSREERDVLRRLNDLSHAPLRFIVGQSQSTIDLRKVMDEGKILLVKLDRQREQATSLIGSILVAQILNAANTRQTNKLFNLYADEFQNFATEDFAILLEQARKRGIGVTMAHQNRAQLELSDRQANKNLRARTLNVGNLVVFRVPTDAEELAKQFKATPKPPDIIGQESVQVRATDGVFDRLLNGHSNETIRRFMKTYGVNWRQYLGPSREAEIVINSLKIDKVFEQVNAGANPEQVLKRYYHDIVDQCIWTGPRQQRDEYYRKLEPSLLAALHALAKEPVMADTGRYIPKYGTEETIANAQARIANELGRLPKFTAKVKLSDGSGNPVEHTIQTCAPGKGLYGQALRERQERIHQQNIKDKYIRPRKEIEEEIVMRQSGQNNALDVKGPQGNNPGYLRPAGSPPPRRRKLEPDEEQKVTCKLCGILNDHDARFCKECGQKLPKLP